MRFGLFFRPPRERALRSPGRSVLRFLAAAQPISSLFTRPCAHPPPLTPPRLPLAPQVVLLDPVIFPGAIKVFAREVCRNDLLNFGRMHWFFPDSRLALDLSTDRTLKEARFDRWAQAGSGCSTLCLCASVGGRGQRGGRGECGALMRSS